MSGGDLPASAAYAVGPVKILLEAKADGNPQALRAGMSAVVTVRLK